MYRLFTKNTVRYFALLIALITHLSSKEIKAQTYCTPTVTSTTYYISSISYGVVGAGSQWITGNNGYSATVGSSSKTVPRYYAGSSSFWYGITNTTGSSVTVYVQCFTDWNHDGDFSDFSEAGTAAQMTIPGNSTTSTGMNVPPTLDAVTGSTRMRIIVSQNSNITDPCAAVTGEVEDYIITVANSSAPVLSTSASIALNPLTTTQTASEGFTVNQLVTGSMPSASLITDPDDSPSYYVPRGVAVTGITAANGSWQYKIGTGSWTAISGVSTSNALLLLGDGSDSRYQPATRLRFVPTGAGSTSLGFCAWDGTTGTNGTYANATSNGGSTAFSSNTTSATLTVNAASPARTFYLGSATADNIITAPFDPTSAQAYNPSTIVSGNVNLTNIADMDLDAVNNKLYWTESSTADKLVRSDLNGSNVTVLYNFPSGTSIPLGIAIGGGKMFYTDNGTGYKAVYRAALDGTGITQITGGTGQLATPNQVRDVEYYNGKIYVITRATSSSSYSIYQIDTNGSNAVEIANTTNLPQYLAVGSGSVFWTEVVSGTGSLYSKPISGGSTTTLISASGRTYRDMLVDAANSKVYYIDYNSASNLPVDRAIMSVPISGGSATKLMSLPDTYVAMASDINPISLAITLIDFTGKALASGNQLSWTIAHEGKDARYTVERSSDGRNYQAIGLVNGQGSKQYYFEDRELREGISYYRLHMQDAEGEDSYSKVVSIRRTSGTGNTIMVYPNPAHNILTVAGATPQLLELYNTVGQKVASASASASISLEKLPAGCYNLRVTIAGSGEVTNQRIVKE